MRVATFIALLLFSIIPTSSPQAQLVEAGTFLTIGSIRQGLNETLTGIQSATVTAGSEARALGNSLQSNIQNVIADIDARFAKRLDYTFEKMDIAERQFATDARDLIYRSRAAAKALTVAIGDESRRTIGEADIAAYNTSYSLPCRSQAPRIVYWTPTQTVAKGEEIIVSVHGNFLNFGNRAIVLIDGKPTPSFTRNDRIISIKIPKEIIQNVKDTSSVSIEIANIDKRTVEPRMMSWLFGCSEKLEPVKPSSITVSLVPRFHYRVESEVWATYKEWSEPFVQQAGTVNKNDDNCDHDENVSFQACFPAEGMRAVKGEYQVHHKSGPSSFGPATVSGGNCVRFDGRLKGSGYNWVAGFKNCRGSARLHADWQVIAQKQDSKEVSKIVADNTLPIGLYSHAVNNTQTPRGDDWRWRYIVRISQLRGSSVISSETLSDGRMDNGRGWVSTMRDGVLTVSLPSEDN